jgi:hypothetical protein
LVFKQNPKNLGRADVSDLFQGSSRCMAAQPLYAGAT